MGVASHLPSHIHIHECHLLSHMNAIFSCAWLGSVLGACSCPYARASQRQNGSSGFVAHRKFTKSLSLRTILTPAQVHCHEVHPRFGDLRAPCISSRLQLAALYAATSTMLPEPSSRMTGACYSAYACPMHLFPLTAGCAVCSHFDTAA